MSHDDDTKLGKIMTRHFRNAREWKRRGGTVIGKEGKNSPRKMDAAVAATLAFEAAADFVSKKKSKRSRRAPSRIR